MTVKVQGCSMPASARSRHMSSEHQVQVALGSRKQHRCWKHIWRRIGGGEPHQRVDCGRRGCAGVIWELFWFSLWSTLVVMLLHAYGARLPSTAGGEWQTELEKLLGIPLVQGTDAAAAAGDRPVGTLSCHPPPRTIHYFFVSAKIRSIVVSPEHPLSRPCHLKPDREVRWAWNTDKNHVVRRLPAVPIFRRLGRGHTSSATHH